MNGIELTRAILYLKPGSEFVIHNEDYSTIQWKVLDGDAPTFAELETANQTIKLAKKQPCPAVSTNSTLCKSKT